MVRSILYATDLGLCAPYVLQHALALARSFAAQLHVVHVVEPVGVLADSLLRSYLDQATLEELETNGMRRVMHGIERRVLEGFHEEFDEPHDQALLRVMKVLQGDPPSVILEQVQALSVDLLVIGSHSQGEQRTTLGRTASRLLQTCDVPVYMVPMVMARN